MDNYLMCVYYNKMKNFKLIKIAERQTQNDCHSYLLQIWYSQHFLDWFLNLVETPVFID